LEGFVDESKEEEEEEEKKMPPRRKSSKSRTPPWKPAAKAAPSVDDVTDGIKNMSVGAGGLFCMDFKFPYIKYNFAVDDRDHFRVDLYVPTLHNDHFRPRIDPDDPTTLLVGIVVPDFFPSKTRLNQAHGGDAGFNGNTHMNTSYKKLADKVYECYDDGSPEPTFIGEPQRIPLPYPCEDDSVVWESQRHINEDEELTDLLGGVQFYTVLSVILRAVHKPKARVVGTTRVVGAVPMQQAPNAGAQG
jgi:hypothetical protein